jgi:uncharacterized damage-inducible protein DinB
MMNAQDVRLLYAYNRWANARVLDAASRLTPEQFTKDLASSHRSVRDTLAHILAAEWIWLMRWKGTSPKALLDPAAFPDQDTLKTRWAEVEREQADFLGGVNEESLASVLGYVNQRGEEWRYPLWQMLQHVVNHSTYHRGQAVTLLRQLGEEPAPTDFLVFFDEGGPARRPSPADDLLRI